MISVLWNIVQLAIVQFAIETVVFSVASSFCSEQTACVSYNMHRSLLVWYINISAVIGPFNLSILYHSLFLF